VASAKGEFEGDDFFDCGTFQNFVATMDGAKFAGMFLKAGRDEMAVSFRRDSLRVFSRVRTTYAGKGFSLQWERSAKIERSKLGSGGPF
jgi:hypothetical protein